MSADIFGDRFYGHREPAWHGLGIVMQEEHTVSEAMQIAGLDYKIQKLPIYAEIGGMQVLIPDREVLVRDMTQDDPQYRIFEVVSKSYGLVQNSDLATLLDPISEFWPVETAGALGLGETVFYTLDAGEFDIKGTPCHKYWLFTDSRTGNRALTFAFTPIRTVCRNTLSSALAAANITSNMAHNETVRDDAELRIMLIKRMREGEQSMVNVFERLADKAIGKEEAVSIIEDAYPLPKKGTLQTIADEGIALDAKWSDRLTRNKAQHDVASQNVLEFREAAFGLYEKMSDEYPKEGGTPWAAYNAVCETEDWREGRIADAVVRSALFGPRAAAKKRALDAALKFVEAPE